MNEQIIAFLAGGLIGIICTLVASIAAYFLYMRDDEDNPGGITAVMFIVTGTLVLVGVVAIVIGIFTGELSQVLLTGAGIFAGIVLTFSGIMLLYRRKLSPESDSE